MKKLMPKLKVLAMSIVASTVAVPVFSANTGDLNIYTPGVGGGAPTILLMVEGSTFTNNADSIKENWADTEIIGLPESSNTDPSYKRYGYYNSISNPGGTKIKVQFPTRLTRMKDAIFYLMDTPGALPDDYKIGLGRFSGGTVVLNNPKSIGDGETSNIVVAAKALGPIPANKGRYVTNDDGTPKLDADGNKIESHRWKIKQYIADMCELDRFCTGNAPMSGAYAEAGAYMMGTKTSRLVDHPGTINSDNIIWPRVLRQSKSDSKWYYCPPKYRKIIPYLDGTTKRFRQECPESVKVKKADGTEETINPWVYIDSNNVASWYWAGPNNKASSEELDAIKDKSKYDLLWYTLAPYGPYGATIGAVDRLSAYDKVIKKYSFSKDSFQNRKPTLNKDGEATDSGTTDNYTYYVDDNTVKASGLYPLVMYRPFRRSRWKDGRDAVWQFCDFEKSKLYNYGYSTYRLTCDEKDWVTVSKDNLTNVKVNGKQIAWDCGWFDTCAVINKPAGTDSPLDSSLWQTGQYFLQDSEPSPSFDWQYYWDTNYKPKGTRKYPSLPATINTGYSASGIRNSPPDVRGDKSYTYVKPKFSECSGQLKVVNGVKKATTATVSNTIIFITAAWPSSEQAMPINEMAMSLTPISSNVINPTGGVFNEKSCDDSGLSNIVGVGDNPVNNHWHCMGAYAKRLKDATKNPAEISIKTGVFMFTANDQILNPTKTDENGIPVYDCNSVAKTTKSQRNACLLGSAAYGGGGFFQSTSLDPEASYKELASAIVTMSKPKVELGIVPAGAAVIPSNPLNPDAYVNTAYLPLVAPDLTGKKSLWQGNLRKYNLSNGVLADKSGNNPTSANVPSLLNEKTLDIWSDKTTAYLSAQQAGGVYEKLPYPTSANTTTNIRQVYLSGSPTSSNALANVDLTQLAATKGAMDAVDLTTAELQKITGTNTVTAEAKSGILNSIRRRLLHFMGFNISQYNSTTTDQNIKDAADQGALTRSFGGVVHSTPIMLTYKAELDAAGKPVLNAANNYILFGSMDGALHVVNDATGVEALAFIPKDMLTENQQYYALSNYGNYNDEQYENMQHPPSFGVDAPWESDPEYELDARTIIAKRVRNSSGNPTKIANMRVYGGLRLGGKAYYGLNLKRNMDTGNITPQQLFRLAPDVANFERMGFTFAKPVITKINWGGTRTKVMIVPAGYDRAYDKKDFERLSDYTNKTKGNAVYVVAAEDTKIKTTTSTYTVKAGQLLLAIGHTDDVSTTVTNKLTNSNMKYSIVGSVRVLDRDADSLTDHIYFADLGGQVWRVDLDNYQPRVTDDKTKDSPAVRLVRLANLTAANGTDMPGPRFYETPLVTIHDEGEKRFAVVSVAAGDRTNPTDNNGETTYKELDANGQLETKTKPTTYKPYKNKVFAIIDKDVARQDLFKSGISLYTQNVTESEMEAKPTPATDALASAMKANMLLTGAATGQKDGWYYPLERFGLTKDGQGNDIVYTGINNLKALGPLSAINNRLYVSVYNPKDATTEEDSCAAQVAGATEAHVYCLPFGFCKPGQPATSNGTYNVQRYQIGKGITPASYAGTTGDAGGLNRKVVTLSGQTPSTIEADGPDDIFSYNFNYLLQPMRWYSTTKE